MKNNTQLVITKDLAVNIQPHQQHGFLMDSQQVANGFGVSRGTIREHKRSNGDEFTEGKHFVNLKGVRNPDTLGGPQTMTYWTQRGVIRLSFFIKSATAKAMRDKAEDYLVNATYQPTYQVQNATDTLLKEFAKKVRTLHLNGKPHYAIRDVRRLIGCVSTGGHVLRGSKKGIFKISTSPTGTGMVYLTTERLQQYLTDSPKPKAAALYQALFANQNALA